MCIATTVIFVFLKLRGVLYLYPEWFIDIPPDRGIYYVLYIYIFYFPNSLHLIDK